MTAPDDAKQVLDTVIGATVTMLDKLNSELTTSQTDSVSGDTVRAEAQKLQDELDKVNAGSTPVPAPVDPPAVPSDPSDPANSPVSADPAAPAPSDPTL